MSDNKKYYYLKLKETFYSSEDLKIIESMENGFIYSNLYLKMILLSLKDEGRLLFKGRIPYSEKMISTITGIPIDNVRCGIKILSEYGMIEILESGVMYMTDIQDLIGQGSTEAERKARYRKRINEEKGIVVADGTKPGHCPGHRTPELEIEKESHIELDLDPELEKKKDTLFSPPKESQESNNQEMENLFPNYNHKKSIFKFANRWNELDLSPQCRVPPGGLEILDGIKKYSPDEVLESFELYKEITSDKERYYNPVKYPTGLSGFLKKGVAVYCASSKPRELFLNKNFDILPPLDERLQKMKKELEADR